jgi:hypothetical protein
MAASSYARVLAAGAAAIAMMKRPGGSHAANTPPTTLDWQSHTVRGFVAGTLTEKMGLAVTPPNGVRENRWFRANRAQINLKSRENQRRTQSEEVGRSGAKAVAAPA